MLKCSEMGLTRLEKEEKFRNKRKRRETTRKRAALNRRFRSQFDIHRQFQNFVTNNRDRKLLLPLLPVVEVVVVLVVSAIALLPIPVAV